MAVLRFILEGPVLLLLGAVGFLIVFNYWSNWYDRQPRRAAFAAASIGVTFIAGLTLVALASPY